jgi:hypothetical protein
VAKVLIEMECADLHEYVVWVDHPQASGRFPPEKWVFDPGQARCPKCRAEDDLDTCSTGGWNGTFVNRTLPKGEWLPQVKTRGKVY